MRYGAATALGPFPHSPSPVEGAGQVDLANCGPFAVVKHPTPACVLAVAAQSPLREGRERSWSCGRPQPEAPEDDDQTSAGAWPVSARDAVGTA
jgi:hypothetical protein